jgi:hypothetical protein
MKRLYPFFSEAVQINVWQRTTEDTEVETPDAAT